MTTYTGGGIIILIAIYEYEHIAWYLSIYEPAGGSTGQSSS